MTRGSAIMRIKKHLLTRQRIVLLNGSRGSLKREIASAGSMHFPCSFRCTEGTLPLPPVVHRRFSHSTFTYQRMLFSDRAKIPPLRQGNGIITRFVSAHAPLQRSHRVTTDEIHEKARDLLNPDLFPLGSFTNEQYAAVKFVLYHFINLQQPTSKEDVNIPIDVLLRLAHEIAHKLPKPACHPNDPIDVHHELHTSTNVLTYEWLLTANYYNPIFVNWKNASLKHRIIGIYSGLDIMQKIQQMSRALPPSIFKYNMYTVTMILQVIIKQVRRDEAPIVAEKLLDSMQQQLLIQTRYAEQDEHRSATWQKEVGSYQPNQYVFSILLKAWAESRLDNAEEKIESILEDMSQRSVSCNHVTYGILLHFYSRMGAVDRVNRILQQMHAEGISITVDCLVQALLCCTKAGLVENATEILRTIVQKHGDSLDRKRGVGEGIQHILMAYRGKVASKESFNVEGIVDVTDEAKQYQTQSINAAVDAARALVEDPMIVQALDAPSKDRMFLTMMDIYACAAMLHKAEELSDTAFPKSAETYCMLIKTYGNTDNALDATRLLNKLLDSEDHVVPTTQMFNMVLDAWAKSSAVTALYRAYEVFYAFDKHPKCIQNNIRRDIITYGSILKCIVAADAPQGPEKAEEILTEMETKYQKHLAENPDTPEGSPDVVKPDKIIYTLVMKAWFQAGESDKALATVKRMEDNAGILPDRRMYNEMIQHFAKVGTDDAATAANRIMKALKQKMKPDFYSYSLLCKTWLKSGDPEALDRLWDIYDEMRAENIHPDKFLYLQFVQSLTATKQLSYIQKAEQILNELEKGPKGFLSPTHYSMIFMAYLDIDDGDRAVEILTRFVYTFGQVDGPFTAIINQLTKLWIKKGDIKKATFLVNTMQEFFNTGMLMQGPSRETYVSLRNAWLASDDLMKDHVAEQIQSILLNLPTTDDVVTNSSVEIPEHSALTFLRYEIAAAMGSEAGPFDITSNCDPVKMDDIDDDKKDVLAALSDADVASHEHDAGRFGNVETTFHEYKTGVGDIGSESSLEEHKEGCDLLQDGEISNISSDPAERAPTYHEPNK